MSELGGPSVPTQYEGTETERIKVDRQADDDTVLAKLGEIIPKPEENGKWTITWKEQSQGRTNPSTDTIAIVIDVPEENTGAVKVFERETGIHRFTVGTGHKGYKVIVPWHQEWWFRVSGSLKIGYISVIQSGE
jgi:hypothetical protein